MGNRQSLNKFSTRNNRSSIEPKITRRRLDPHSQLIAFRRPIQHQLEAVAPSALLIGIPSHSARHSARPWNRNERLVKTSNISISSLLLFTTLIYVRSIFRHFQVHELTHPSTEKRLRRRFEKASINWCENIFGWWKSITFALPSRTADERLKSMQFVASISGAVSVRKYPWKHFQRQLPSEH